MPFTIEEHTIPAADTTAFHVVDQTGKERGRFLFKEDAMTLCNRLNREAECPPAM